MLKKSRLFMVNSEFDELKNWMFGSLNKLLEGIQSNKNFEIIKMTLGEPILDPPKFIEKYFTNSLSDWGKYPPAEALPVLNNAIMHYLSERFEGSKGIVNKDNILPVPGSREPLHLVGLIAKNKNKKDGIAIVTNPFYHAWRLGGIESSSKIYWINADSKNNYNPDIVSIPTEILSSTDIMYLCFPSNPQGATTNLDYLITAIDLARKYNFIIAFDECYIDISRLNKSKPIGALDALVKTKSNLDNIIIFNSLSKRSNAPGLRAGFIVGDKKIIDIYKLLVSNGASPVPIPIQKAAASLYIDQKHNISANKHYDRNFEIAFEFLNSFFPNFKIPDAGFYLWLPVKDDLKTTQDLWRYYSLRVMPGRFMGKEINGYNPGKGFLRLALVDNENVIKDAMIRLTDYLKNTKYE